MDSKSLQEAAIQSLKNPGANAKPLPKTDQTRPVLYLFRHCQTHDNIRKIFSGRRQSTLTEKGWSQARSIAQLLKDKKIDMFMSPPQRRCEQTLQPVRELFPHVPYIPRKDLFERNYGDLTGKSKMTIMKLYPEKAVLWRRSWDVPPPNGESLKEVWETRVKGFCEWLEKEMREKQINVAYCGTNNTVRLIRWYFEKMPMEEMLVLESPYGDYASYHIA